MALLALLAAACWGAADFVGGQVSRRVHVLSLTLVSQVTGAAVLGAIVLARSVEAPDADVLPVAIGAGLANFLAVCGLYLSLAMGVMARIAPIFALSAVVPVVFGLAGGEDPTWPQLVGIVLALTGVALISSGPATTAAEGRMRIAVPLAIASSVSIGLALVGVNEVSERHDHYWAVFMTRTGSATFTALAAVAILRGRLLRQNRPVPIGIPIGVVDVAALVLFAFASTAGLLSLAAVLASTFPVMTVLLALLLLDERMTRVHATGAVATLVGGALIIGG